MPRWLVTGANGQLGSDVVAVLEMYGEDVVACASFAGDEDWLGASPKPARETRALPEACAIVRA